MKSMGVMNEAKRENGLKAHEKVNNNKKNTIIKKRSIKNKEGVRKVWPRAKRPKRALNPFPRVQESQSNDSIIVCWINMPGSTNVIQGLEKREHGMKGGGPMAKGQVYRFKGGLSAMWKDMETESKEELEHVLLIFFFPSLSSTTLLSLSLINKHQSHSHFTQFWIKHDT